MLFEPMELMERLAVLVPPPRFHMTRYHGVLAPRASWRDAVVPAEPDAASPKGASQYLGAPVNARARPQAVQGTLRFVSDEATPPGAGAEAPPPPARTPWAELLERVFGRNVLGCPECGRRMRVVGPISSPDAIRSILDRIRGPSRPPPGPGPRRDLDGYLPFGA